MSTTFFPCGNEYRPGYRPLPNPIKKPPGGGGGVVGTKKKRIPPPPFPRWSPTDPMPPFAGGPGGPGTASPAPPNPGGGGPGGGGTGGVLPPGTPGPPTPSTLFRCEPYKVYCPTGEEKETRYRCVSFQSFLGVGGAPPGEKWFSTLLECQNNCGAKPTTGPRRTDPCPSETGEIYSVINPPQPPGETGTVGLGDTNVNTRITRRSIGIADLRDSVGGGAGVGSFFDNLALGAGSTQTQYDPIRNIFDYSRVVTGDYVNNNKFLTILNRRIAREIYYILDSYNSSEGWKEKYILSLDNTKVYNSLSDDFRLYTSNLLSSDGQIIPQSYFVDAIYNHIINNTLGEVDINYYKTLYERSQSRTILKISEGEAKDDTKFVMDYVKAKMLSADPNSYSEPQHQIEIARLKFLPTDVEVRLPIEFLDGSEEELILENAGVSFTEQESTEDQVPLGEGDGYYILLENGQGLQESLLPPGQEPILLRTSLEFSNYLPLQDRRTALTLLGEDPFLTFTVSSSFINSELSSGYQEVYTAEPKYFKLDLSSVEDNINTHSYVNNVIAKYSKLTEEEATQHSKTYGAKALKVNIPFDDPFFQYADVEGLISLAYNEITFRSSDINKSPTGNQILVRSLPDALVIYPARTTEEKPFNVYSEITDITDDYVVRQYTTDTDIGLLFDRDINRPSLPYQFTYNLLGEFSYGLAGIIDTQNILYVYTPSSFNVSYQVSGRPPVGDVVYNILENTINAKYDFSYLTWWDLYRRMTIKQFLKFINNVPEFFINKLANSWRSYKFKDALYRGRFYVPDNLSEISSDVEDTIILQESFDRFN
jgi:hypothetical protein